MSLQLDQGDLDNILDGLGQENDENYAEFVTGEVLKKDILVIKIDGRALGMDESAAVLNSISKFMKDVEQHVILDLSNCSFFASHALGVLIKFAAAHSKKGFRLIMAGANAAIIDLIYITKIDLFATIVPSVEAGVELLE